MSTGNRRSENRTTGDVWTDRTGNSVGTAARTHDYLRLGGNKLGWLESCKSRMKPVCWKVRKSEGVESRAFETIEAVESVEFIEGREPVEFSKPVETLEPVKAKPSPTKRQRIKFGPTKTIETAKAKRMELAHSAKTPPRKTAFEFAVSKSTSKSAFESEMAGIAG